MRKVIIGVIAALVIAAPAFAGGSSEPEEPEIVVAPNKVVEVHYEGKLADGTVFDSSDEDAPLEFVYGVGMLIPGLEEGMEGMAIGEKATIEVLAEDAYGPHDDQQLQEIPRSQIDPEIELEEGMQLMGQSPQGPMIVTVVEFDEQNVMIDFNHPLAGEDLTFEIEVISIRDATDDELEQMLGPGAAGTEALPTE